MTDLDDLYAFADKKGIDVDYRIMNTAQCLSVQITDEICAICIDPCKLSGRLDEKMKLSHELGHCETLSFYHAYSPYETIGRCERRVLVWQIKKLVPKDELSQQISRNNKTPWELAEYFGVTEKLIKQAIEYYKED